MKKNDHTDPVEDAFHSFQEMTIPDGPSVELTNATADRLRTLNFPTRAPEVPRENRLRSAARCSSAIAVCILFVVAASWIGMLSQTSGIAFADVKQQLAKTHTVRYVETRLAEEASDDIEEMREMERKGVKAAPERIFRTANNGHQPRIIRVSGRHLQRTEVLNEMGVIDSIQISDHNRGKHVTLIPKQRKFMELDTQVTIEMNSDKKTEEKIKPTPDADLFARISEIPTEATTELPVRTIAGQKVTGFFWQQTTPTKGGTVTWERTYWVDPITKLPVRVEVSYYGTDKRVGRSDWILSNFVFDEEIPADLFNTDPPEGYSQETQKIMGIKID